MNFSQKLLLTLAAGLMTSTVMAQANPEDHKAHHPDAAAPAASAVSPKAAPASATTASGGMYGHMSKHCKEMQEVMAIQDPVKRQKAIASHMQEGDCDMMKNGMGMAGAMGGQMGAGMQGDMKGGMAASPAGGGMKPMGK